MLRKLLTKINNGFAEISAISLTIIAILLVLNVITRYFGMHILGLVEISTFVFLIIVYLALGKVEEEDNHIKVNFVLDKLQKKKRMYLALNIFNYILATIVGGILVYAVGISAKEAYLDNESISGIMYLPTFPVKFIMFVGLLIFFLQSFVKLYGFIKIPNEKSKH